MMDRAGRAVWSVPGEEEVDYCEEFVLLRTAWDRGLQPARIYELHSEHGSDLVMIAMRVVADAVRRGLSVAYYDVREVLSHDLIRELVWGGAMNREVGWGGFEAFYPSTIDHLHITLHESYSSDEQFDLIVFDSITDLHLDSPSEHGQKLRELSDLQEREGLLDHLLLQCKDWIARTRQSMILLNIETPKEMKSDSPEVCEAASSLDRHCDTRTEVSRCVQGTSQHSDGVVASVQDLQVWNTKDHRVIPPPGASRKN